MKKFKKSSKKGIAIVLVLMVLMVLMLLISVVGCSPNDNNSSAQEKQNEDTLVEVSNKDEEIVITGYRDPGRGTKDPYFTNVNLYVWEPLIGESDNGEVEPRLSTSWEMSEDGKIWTFHLREGVSFSDGYPFNADAVLQNFDRYKKLGVASSTFFSFDVTSVYPGLLDVVKVDDYTVDLVFENPVPTLPYTIINFGSGMFSPDCYNQETGEFKEFCIGTGPFVIKEHVPEQYLLLERNENFYGEKAKAKNIRIKIIPDHETRVAALRSGEVMAVYDNNAIQPQAAKMLVNEGGFIASSSISANIHYVNVNNRNFPFNDVRMRQAMSMIIDRDALVGSIYYGYGESTINVLSPLSVFYKDIKPEYNPEKAKELASEVLKGETPEVRLLTASTYKTDAELIAAWFGELGLKVNIQVLDSAAVADALKNKDFDLSMGFKGMNNAEPETMLRGFMHTDGFMNNGYAMSGYHNEEVDALLDTLRNTYDKEERIELYNQLQVIASEELPVIPLFGIDTLVVHSDKITGYDAMFTGVTLPNTTWSDSK